MQRRSVPRQEVLFGKSVLLITTNQVPAGRQSIDVTRLITRSMAIVCPVLCTALRGSSKRLSVSPSYRLLTPNTTTPARALSVFAEITTHHHAAHCRMRTPLTRLRARTSRRRYKDGSSSSQGSSCACTMAGCPSVSYQDS